MAKTAAITVRVTDRLKRSLEARAKSQHRSLSAQVVVDLERAVAADESRIQGGERGRFVGLFSGARLPSEAEIIDVRRRLWGRLGERAS